jgi:hypothetical protein
MYNTTTVKANVFSGKRIEFVERSRGFHALNFRVKHEENIHERSQVAGLFGAVSLFTSVCKSMNLFGHLSAFSLLLRSYLTGKFCFV